MGHEASQKFTGTVANYAEEQQDDQIIKRRQRASANRFYKTVTADTTDWWVNCVFHLIGLKFNVTAPQVHACAICTAAESITFVCSATCNDIFVININMNCADIYTLAANKCHFRSVNFQRLVGYE